jgi:hypothetical protein
VLSIVQRDGGGRPPLFIRSKDDVYSFAQAGDWLATGILHLPLRSNHGPVALSTTLHLTVTSPSRPCSDTREILPGARSRSTALR